MVLELAVLRVNVAKATKEPGEMVELEAMLEEVLETEEMTEELLTLEVRMLLRLEYVLYSEDDVFDETLRSKGELSGKGIPCGWSCGCGRT